MNLVPHSDLNLYKNNLGIFIEFNLYLTEIIKLYYYKYLLKLFIKK